MFRSSTRNGNHGKSGMDNRCEPILKTVRYDKPKVMIGLNQNGEGYGEGFG